MQINNYVWENDLSLNDLVLKQKEEIERLKKSEKEALDTLESATYENINLTNEVDRLNNIINECAEDILKEIQENHHLSCGVALAIRQKLIDYREIKGEGSNE